MKRKAQAKIKNDRFYSFYDVLSRGLAAPEQMATYIESQPQLTRIDQFGRLILLTRHTKTNASKDSADSDGTLQNRSQATLARFATPHSPHTFLSFRNVPPRFFKHPLEILQKP